MHVNPPISGTVGLTPNNQFLDPNSENLLPEDFEDNGTRRKKRRRRKKAQDNGVEDLDESHLLAPRRSVEIGQNMRLRRQKSLLPDPPTFYPLPEPKSREIPLLPWLQY